MADKSLEKAYSKKIKGIDSKVKNSFIFIRQDIAEMKETVEAMRNYLKKKDKQYKYAQKEDNKIRDEFRHDVEAFTQKISQLKLALSTVNALKNELVVVKDLARIEDEIKTSFKNEVEDYKELVKKQTEYIKELEKRIKDLEKSTSKEQKGSWFEKLKNNSSKNNNS